MRLLVVVTDTDAMAGFERALIERDVAFTVIPRVFGRGRSGVHAGDRVHPGGSALLFTVVPEERAAATIALLEGARDAVGAGELTRMFSLPAEQIG